MGLGNPKPSAVLEVALPCSGFCGKPYGRAKKAGAQGGLQLSFLPVSLLSCSLGKKECHLFVNSTVKAENCPGGSEGLFPYSTTARELGLPRYLNPEFSRAH